MFVYARIRRIGMAKYQSSREMGYAENEICQKDSKCKPEKTTQEIRCSQCGHKLVPKTSKFLNHLVTPHAKSVRNLDLFGQENVTVQEFVNPHDFHFHSIQVKTQQNHLWSILQLLSKT